jgi:hypothetical protein
LAMSIGRTAGSPTTLKAQLRRHWAGVLVFFQSEAQNQPRGAFVMISATRIAAARRSPNTAGLWATARIAVDREYHGAAGSLAATQCPDCSLQRFAHSAKILIVSTMAGFLYHVERTNHEQPGF